MQKLILYHLFSVIFVISCTTKEEKQVAVPLGRWRAVIHTQGKELPFELTSKRSESGDIHFVINNDEENIVLDRFELKGDSLVLPLHIFDTKIVAAVADNELNGYWTKNYVEDYVLPFTAEFSDTTRFEEVSDPVAYDFSGRWAAEFYSENKRYPAIGEFQQGGSNITGTFLTETGDYRFLEGSLTRTGFQLSTFDGEHAYLFEATLGAGDTLTGEYWSGKTGYYRWKAYRNENAMLANAESLTRRKDPGTLHLAYPNEKGDTVRLSDPRYEGKVVILQILGSWCANCMDETAFLSEWYQENQERGVEIIGLAFERKGDFEYGASRIRILKNRYDIGYEILFAGKNDRETKDRVLYMITDLVSFPTTLFLDKGGRIQKIHTGFTGPGTGEHYEEFVREFNVTVDSLLAE